MKQHNVIKHYNSRIKEIMFSFGQEVILQRSEGVFVEDNDIE
jgi:hypothetical protein